MAPLSLIPQKSKFSSPSRLEQQVALGAAYAGQQTQKSLERRSSVANNASEITVYMW